LSSKDNRIIGFLFIALVMVGAVVGYAAIPQNTLRHNAGIVMPTVNATAGYYVGANQVIDATTAATFATVNTGQGANELYDMDQNVLTTSDVNFSSLETDNLIVRGALNATQLALYPQQPASYIIWKDGSTYYAKNGATGSIDYRGADAATVIQNTIDALSSGVIYIRAGEYNLTSTITINKPIWLQGEGSSGETGVSVTLLNNTQTDGSSAIAINPSSNIWGITLSDIEIEGNSNSGKGIEIGAGAGGAHRFLLRNLYIHNHGQHGVTIKHSYFGLVEGCLIESNGIYGIYFLDGAKFNVVRGGRLDSNAGNGIRIAGDSTKITVEDVDLESNINDQILVYDSDAVNIKGCYIDASGQIGIKVDSSGTAQKPRGTVIRDTLFISNTVGISVTNASQTYISNNRYSGVTTDVSIGAASSDTMISEDGMDTLSNSGTNTRVQGCPNYITENAGNATLAAVTSSIAVNHGCDYTPTLGDIQVTPNRDLGNCTYYWIDTITSTQFTIHVGAAGAEKNIDKTVYFLWSVRRH